MVNIQFALIFPKVEYFLSFTIETGLFYNHFIHNYHPSLHFFGSVQSLSCVQWTAVCQASLSITNSQSLLKFMNIKSVIPSNHLILCCPLLLLPSVFSSIRVFSSQFFTSGGQSIGASVSASVLQVDIQDWYPLGWTGWISLQSKGLSRVFSNTTLQKHQFFDVQPSPGDLPDPGSNPHLLCLLHCRRILFPLSHWRSLK